jgi:hypothetical protein
MNICYQWSARTFAAFFLFVAAVPAFGQTIDSPYRFVENSQALGAYGGWVSPGRGALNLGPEAGAVLGARYTLRVSGAFNLDADLSYFASRRIVYDTVPADTALRVAGQADMKVLALIAGLRFDVTGPRTWRGLQPYVVLGGGLAFDLAGDAAAEESLAEDIRFDFGTRLLGTVGGGVEAHLFRNITLRGDARALLWKLNTPRPFLFGEPANYRPADEWTQNAYLSAGISYRF